VDFGAAKSAIENLNIKEINAKESRQSEQFRQRSEAKGSVAESLIHGSVSPIVL
jgi:hypothetical protein